jgi:hypothetical protein
MIAKAVCVAGRALVDCSTRILRSAEQLEIDMIQTHIRPQDIEVATATSNQNSSHL